MSRPIISQQERVAHRIVSAMEAGQDLIIPGIPNKLYAHILCKVLPRPLVTNIASVSHQTSIFWHCSVSTLSLSVQAVHVPDILSLLLIFVHHVYDTYKQQC